MPTEITFDELNDALTQVGADWRAAGAHGLATGRLAATGEGGLGDWQGVVLEGVADSGSADSLEVLASVWRQTYRELSERQSAFQPLLPDDAAGGAARTEALARWSESFLHGLVSVEHDAAAKERLAAEPVAGIIKDMLEISRASAAEGGFDEAAYTEIVEYVRVATQLVYEELAELRPQSEAGGG